MKIIWLCNVRIPLIERIIGEKQSVFGGWLDGALNSIMSSDDNEVLVLYPSYQNEKGESKKLLFRSFKQIINYDENSLNDLTEFFVSQIESFCPDVIHIWGTEFNHSLCMVKACDKLSLLDRTVISIQGLIHKCADVYSFGLPRKILNRKTIRDIVKKDSIKLQKQSFIDRGKSEKLSLRMAKNVIGRTDWDRFICREVNPNLNYFFCNETLRDDFYNTALWDKNSCIKNRIFVSQASYPLKGFHYAIEAANRLKIQYPNIKLCVTIDDIINCGWRSLQKKPYYFLYLRKLIKRYRLENNIEFLGQLSSKRMIEEYKKANIFLSCSHIENSSNAIGEAMILGVPVVASAVGGTPSMITHNLDGILYAFDDVEQMVNSIKKVLEDDIIVDNISHSAHIKAMNRHDREANNNNLLNIYKQLQSK